MTHAHRAVECVTAPPHDRISPVLHPIMNVVGTARLLTATGTVTMQPDGGFTMVLDPGEYRWDSFMYEACDPGGCFMADVTLEVFEA